jgi:DNA-binding CsgD family transcriptional regulator
MSTVMKAERARHEPEGGGASSPPLQPSERADTSVGFSIGDHPFVAIPEAIWTFGHYRGHNGAKLRVVGYVRLAGVRHVLIERHNVDEAEASAPISGVLTSRELQIAYSVAEGKGDKMIAHALGISEYTVREHMRRIFHKLKVSKRAALVAHLISARCDFGVTSAERLNSPLKTP